MVVFVSACESNPIKRFNDADLAPEFLYDILQVACLSIVNVKNTTS